MTAIDKVRGVGREVNLRSKLTSKFTRFEAAIKCLRREVDRLVGTGPSDDDGSRLDGGSVEGVEGDRAVVTWLGLFFHFFISYCIQAI